jgi:hypothetical protein
LVQLAELAGGDAAARAEAENDDRPELSGGGQATDRRQPGLHLPVDLGVDVHDRHNAPASRNVGRDSI